MKIQAMTVKSRAIEKSALQNHDGPGIVQVEVGADRTILAAEEKHAPLVNGGHVREGALCRKDVVRASCVRDVRPRQRGRRRRHAEHQPVIATWNRTTRQ